MTKLSFQGWLLSTSSFRKNKRLLLLFCLTIITIPIVVWALLLAFNYVLLIVSSCTCAVIIIFVISIKKDTSSSTKQDLIKTKFDQIFSPKTHTKHHQYHDDRLKEAELRVAEFKRAFTWFWIAIGALYAAILIDQIITLSTDGFQKLTLNQSEDQAKQKNDLVSLKNSTFTTDRVFEDSINKISVKEKPALPDILKKISQPVIKDSEKETISERYFFNLIKLSTEDKIDSVKNTHLDTINLKYESLIFPDSLKKISLDSLDKKSRSYLLQSLLNSNLISTVLFRATSDSENILKYVLDNFDTTIGGVNSSKTKEYEQYLIQFHNQYILTIDSSLYFFIGNKFEFSASGNRHYESNYFKKNQDQVSVFFNIVMVVLNSISMIFLFKCFLSLYVFPLAKNHKNKKLAELVAYSWVTVFLLLMCYLTFTFLAKSEDLFVISTTFNAFTGIAYGIIFCLFVGRLDSKLMSLRSYFLPLLFLYPALQPLFTAFFDINAMIPTIALTLALFLKVYLFLIVFFLIDTGRILTYFYCFPELDKRINQIYHNQFEIVMLPLNHEDEYTFEIRNKNKIIYKTHYHSSRDNCFKTVEYLQNLFQPDYEIKKSGTENNWYTLESYDYPLRNIYWSEIKFHFQEENPHEDKSKKKNLITLYSIQFQTKRKLTELEKETKEKLPFCKIGFA